MRGTARGGVSGAAIVAVLSSVLVVAAAALELVALTTDIAWTWGTRGGAVVWTLALLAYPVTGWLIAHRHPRHRIGWLLLWIGSVAGLHLLAVAYGGQGLVRGWPAAAHVAGIGNFGWALWIGPIVVLLAPLFPDGRALSPRWRIPIVVGTVGLLVGALGEALRARPLDIDPRFATPWGTDGPVVEAMSAGIFVLPWAMAAAAIALTLRYRRSDAIGRLQLRGFLAVVVVGVVLFSSALALPTSNLGVRLLQDASNLTWSALAIAVGVAVLRYRLYAIDRAINRALVYSVLTGLLVVVYLAGVTVLRPVLRPLTGSGDLAVASSTLAVAALFQPARRRVQRLIDRRFSRTRYDAAAVLADFGARLRDEMHVEAIVAELRRVAAGTTQPAALHVWLPRARAPRPAPRRT